MIIALGYRVQSQVATRFRRWATQRLHEYIQKEFARGHTKIRPSEKQALGRADRYKQVCLNS